MLQVDAIRPFSALRFEGFDSESGFFIAPAMNPRTVHDFHPIFSAISASVAPFLRWSMAITWAVLLPSRGPAASRFLAAFLALGAFLAGLAFVVALALGGAPWPPVRHLGLLGGFRLRGFGLGLRGVAKSLDGDSQNAAGGGIGRS